MESYSRGLRGLVANQLAGNTGMGSNPILSAKRTRGSRRAVASAVKYGCIWEYGITVDYC